jgi:hypothetical protein
VLPVFNGERTIARAIQSILDQTVRDLELIVVDDGSTDGTLDRIARVPGDSRLRLVSRDHAGVVAAANAATEAAAAPFIARMDADDFAYPERLERQLELLQDSRFDVVGCQVRIVDESNRAIASMNRYQAWINEETLTSEQILALRFVEFPLVNPTITARREYFELGFRQGAFPEDYDLMLRAAECGMRFGKVAEILLDWTDHPMGLTRSDPRFTPTAFCECRRSHLLAGPLGRADTNEVDIWGVGQAGKPWIRALHAASITVRRAYDISDRKIGSTIHGVCVASPSDLPPTDGTPLLIAVGAENARQIILPQILDRGYVPGHTAWFVA